MYSITCIKNNNGEMTQQKRLRLLEIQEDRPLSLATVIGYTRKG
jgi:hypothetical protein